MGEEKKSFDEIFTEAVEEGLETLGESAKQMIFFYLEKEFSLSKDEISKNPEALVQGLEKIFKAGALVLERIIIEKLYLKLGLKYEERDNNSFIDCVKQAKEEMQRKL